MPQSKKIANPEYVELEKCLKAAQSDSKKKSAAMTLAFAAAKVKESEISRLERTISSHREKLSGLIERAEDYMSLSKDATALVRDVIEKMKETPRTVNQD